MQWCTINSGNAVKWRVLKSNRKKCQWNSEQERTKDNFTKTFQKMKSNWKG